MNNQNSAVDRRKFKRTLVNFIVFYNVNSPLEIRIKIGERECEALTSDISEGGMGVYTNYEIPPVTIVTVKFIMINDNGVSAKDRSRSILVQGEVRYNILIKEKKLFRFGIQFIDLSPDDRSFISNFVSASKQQMNKKN